MKRNLRMRMKWAPVALIGVSLLACACRDETSENPLDDGETGEAQISLGEPPIETSEEESVTSPPLPPAPFALAEESFLLSERSLDGQHYENLEAFLASADGAALAKDAGLEIKEAEEEIKLTLSKDLALAFPSMGLDKPLAIETRGHTLSLVGRALRNLNVVTRADGKKAGDVFVYALEEVSGTFDLRGQDGVAGKDGDCPPGFENCARSPGQSFPATSLYPVIERKQEEHVHHDLGAYADRLAFLPFMNPSPPSSGRANCSVSSSPDTRKVEERFEGQLVTRKTVPHVRWEGDLKGRDGWVSPGKAGSPGQDAGRLVIQSLPGATIEVVHLGEGGLGGATGRPGIVQGAPAPLASPISVDAQVTLDGSGARKIYKYFLMYFSTYTGYCGKAMSCTCWPKSRSGEQSQVPASPILHWNEPRDFNPPQRQPGITPVLKDVEPAVSGADGVFEQSQVPALESVSFGEKSIPLDVLLNRPEQAMSSP